MVKAKSKQKQSKAKYNSTRNVSIKKPRPKTSVHMRNKSVVKQRELSGGELEGAGIFKDIGNWLKGAAQKTNKWLKKSKIISKAGPVVGKLVGAVYPQAGKIIADASKFAGQHGYGVSLPGGGGMRKVKSITDSQQQALRDGHGRLLKSGGISLVACKNKNIKNITPAQWRAVQQLRARHMKGGGYSFVKGVAVSPQSTHAYINVTGKKNVRNVKGKGLKLAGQGVSMPAQAGRGYKKKRRVRRKPGPMKM